MYGSIRVIQCKCLLIEGLNFGVSDVSSRHDGLASSGIGITLHDKFVLTFMMHASLFLSPSLSSSPHVAPKVDSSSVAAIDSNPDSHNKRQEVGDEPQQRQPLFIVRADFVPSVQEAQA